MRKVLNNYNKSKRLTGTSKGRVGTLLKIHDKNNTQLHVGDRLRYRGCEGILLYNHEYNEYGVAISDSKWYGDDEYSINSYGKFFLLPMDDGARMEIEKLCTDSAETTSFFD